MARTTLDLGRIPSRERRSRTPSGGAGAADESLFRDRAPAAWKHVDLVLLECAAAVSVLGALMILSSTRGTDPDAYDPSFLRKQVLFIGDGRGRHGARHAGRLPAAARLRLAALRGGGWCCWPWWCRRSAPSSGARRPGSSSAPFQLQPAELAKVAVDPGGGRAAGAAARCRCGPAAWRLALAAVRRCPRR